MSLDTHMKQKHMKDIVEAEFVIIEDSDTPLNGGQVDLFTQD